MKDVYEPKILINGKPAEQISVLDRGLAYGDGVFETARVSAGRVLYWPRHVARLQEGCQRLGIPRVDIPAIELDLEELLGGLSEGVLKIIVTRGPGGRGYRPSRLSVPTVILQSFTHTRLPENVYQYGVQLRLCHTRLGRNPDLAGIKHLNRLEQVLAQSEWQDPEIFEGLMSDENDSLICGTRANVFLQFGDQLHTPDISRCGVAGITRARLLEASKRMGIRSQVRDISVAELREAQAVLISNSIFGIVPVRAVAGKSYEITAMTQQLAKEIENVA